MSTAASSSVSRRRSGSRSRSSSPRSSSAARHDLPAGLALFLRPVATIGELVGLGGAARLVPVGAEAVEHGLVELLALRQLAPQLERDVVVELRVRRDHGPLGVLQNGFL